MYTSFVPSGKCPRANALTAHGLHDVSGWRSPLEVFELGDLPTIERSPDEHGKRGCITLLHSGLCHDEFQLDRAIDENALTALYATRFR